VILGSRDTDEEVAELQGELAGSEILFVVPAVDVGIGGETRVPLGDREDVVAVLSESSRSPLAPALPFPSWML
jgi:hypothetical protein